MTAAPPPVHMQRSPSSRRARIVTGVLLFLAVWTVYRESPVEQVTDAYYTALASLALLDGEGLILDSYLRSRPDQPVIGPTGKRVHSGPWPYQLEDIDGHLRLRYPVGTAVLSAPLLALMRPFGYAPVDSRGWYDPVEDRRINQHLAPFVGAVFILLVYLTASELLSTWWSGGIALVAAFASPAWSTLSRALWSHTWLAVLLAAALWHLVRAERRGVAPNGILLATLLAWAYITRPTAVLAIVAVGIYLLLVDRRQTARYGAVGLVWAGLFVAWSWHSYGRLLPPYYFLLTEARVVDHTPFPEALAGVLVSPSRGLLVFCPWILVLIWMLWRQRRLLPQRRLAYVAGSVCVLQTLLLGAAPRWWGGWSYGPRLQSDMLPWLMLLTVFVVAAWLRSETATGPLLRRVEVAGAVLTVLLSVGLHAPGALSSRTYGGWNRWAHPDTARTLWDWSNPQFLAWRAGS